MINRLHFLSCYCTLLFTVVRRTLKAFLTPTDSPHRVREYVAFTATVLPTRGIVSILSQSPARPKPSSFPQLAPMQPYQELPSGSGQPQDPQIPPNAYSLAHQQTTTEAPGQMLSQSPPVSAFTNPNQQQPTQMQFPVPMQPQNFANPHQQYVRSQAFQPGSTLANSNQQASRAPQSASNPLQENRSELTLNAAAAKRQVGFRTSIRTLILTRTHRRELNATCAAARRAAQTTNAPVDEPATLATSFATAVAKPATTWTTMAALTRKWSQVSDPHERRKIQQQRNAQRKYRNRRHAMTSKSSANECVGDKARHQDTPFQYGQPTAGAEGSNRDEGMEVRCLKDCDDVTINEITRSAQPPVVHANPRVPDQYPPEANSHASSGSGVGNRAGQEQADEDRFFSGI